MPNGNPFDDKRDLTLVVNQIITNQGGTTVKTDKDSDNDRAYGYDR